MVDVTAPDDPTPKQREDMAEVIAAREGCTIEVARRRLRERYAERAAATGTVATDEEQT